MFRIETDPAFWWPVTVRRPAPDKPGEFVALKFEAQYRWLSDADYDALLRECVDKQLLVADVVPRVCMGFRHVQHEDGSPMESNAANLALLCAQQGVPRALWDTYRECRDKAAEKNS
jgi:hypothetical protein